MRDLQIVPVATTKIQPRILGKTRAQGLILYQKLLTLILSSQEDLYRAQAGSTLVQLLEGANTPSDQILQSLGTMACNQAKSCLAAQDAQKISQLSAEAQNGQLYIILTLTSGQTYTGSLAGADL